MSQEPPKTGTLVPSGDSTPSQVSPRTVAVVILTAAAVLGGLYLLWQLRHIVALFVIALFLAVALNPLVSWLQQHHIKRSIAILLTYVVLLLVVVGLGALVVPLLVSEVEALINFAISLSQQPEGWVGALKNLANQYGLGWVIDTFSAQISNLPAQLVQWGESFLSSAGGFLVSAAGFVIGFITVLVIMFFLLLDGEYFVDAGLQLLDEPQRLRAERILIRSAGAVSGYITGNLTISLICGVGVYILLIILGMPYSIVLALIVALLDLSDPLFRRASRWYPVGHRRVVYQPG